MPSCVVMRLEKVLLRPKEPPPDPVSEIWGKNCARATPMSAFEAIKILAHSDLGYLL